MPLQDATTARSSADLNAAHDYSTLSMMLLDAAITSAGSRGEGVAKVEYDVIKQNIVQADDSTITIQSFINALNAKSGYDVSWVVMPGKLTIHVRF